MHGERIVFLIHGVGNPRPGDARRAFEQAASEAGVGFDNLIELNWNELVPGAVQDKKIDHGWLLDLARSFQASADVGMSDDDAGKPQAGRGLAERWQDRAAVALRVVAAFLPLLFIWGLLCMAYQVVHQDVGTPWEAYRFEPAAYKQWWTWFGFLTYPLTVGKWFSAWKFTLLAWLIASLLLVLAVIVVGLFRRNHSSLAVFVRRAFLHWLGPVVYTIGLPFVLRVGLSVGIITYLIFATLIGVPDYQHEVVTPTTLYLTAEVTFSEYVKWDQTKLVLTYLVPIALVATVLLILLSPLLKVTADIFRYLGNPDYRRGIHEGLGEKVSFALESKRNPEIILAGHSLGSVIALDVLRGRPDLFARADSVTLVTGGSPLRRLFHRFFPRYYRQPGEESKSLAARFPRFRWVNVYRPLDYVGASLFTGHETALADVRVPQRWRLHVGYWSDPSVIGAAYRALPEFSPMQAGHSRPVSKNPSDWDKGMGKFRQIRPFWVPALPIGVGLFVAASFWALEPLERVDTFERQLRILQEEGTETSGGALYRRNQEVWESSGESDIIVVRTEYWVRFQDPNSSIVETRLDSRYQDEDVMTEALDAFDQSWTQGLPLNANVGMPTPVLYMTRQPHRAHAPRFYREDWFSYWRIPGGLIQLFLGFWCGALLAAIPANLTGEDHVG